MEFDINHVAINVSNLTASMEFYGKVLGMRHIYTYHISPPSTYRLQHLRQKRLRLPNRGELYRQKSNTAGIIELLHRKDCAGNGIVDPLGASTRKPNTLSHLGLIVPDMMATQRRVKRHNVTIIKSNGVKPTKGCHRQCVWCGRIVQGGG